MKLVSWNVNGIRACITKGFEESFAKLDADIFCLQETKCQENQVKLELPGYYQYWNYANRKGYSGTAVFTKKEPLSVTYGLGIEEHDKEGRVITAEMDDFYLVTVYTPNSQSELRRLEYRMEWERDFLQQQSQGVDFEFGNFLEISVHGICGSGCEIDDPLCGLGVDSLHIKDYCLSGKQVIADLLCVIQGCRFDQRNLHPVSAAHRNDFIVVCGAR